MMLKLRILSILLMISIHNGNFPPGKGQDPVHRAPEWSCKAFAPGCPTYMGHGGAAQHCAGLCPPRPAPSAAPAPGTRFNAGTEADENLKYCVFSNTLRGNRLFPPAPLVPGPVKCYVIHKRKNHARSVGGKATGTVRKESLRCLQAELFCPTCWPRPAWL
jgi:hypothetical protein